MRQDPQLDLLLEVRSLAEFRALAVSFVTWGVARVGIKADLFIRNITFELDHVLVPLGDDALLQARLLLRQVALLLQQLFVLIVVFLDILVRDPLFDFNFPF